MKNYIYECIHMQESGPRGVETRPPSFFPWRLQWGLSVFQWGSNPYNPPSANFYPGHACTWAWLHFGRKFELFRVQQGNYSTTSNNIQFLHWSLMCGL